MSSDQDLTQNSNFSEKFEKIPVNRGSLVEYSEKVSCYLNGWLMI
jgi:hypothetical protein